MKFLVEILNCFCFPVDSPSKISNEGGDEGDDDVMMEVGDGDMASNTIDDSLPGVYDYTYSGVGGRRGGEILIMNFGLVFLVSQISGRWI